MPVERVCLVCHAPFVAKPAKVRNGQGNYCSRRCMYQSRHVSIWTTCCFCDRPFLVPPRRLAHGDGKYCSLECVRQHHATLANVVTRFWSHVLQTDTCWLWQGSLTTTGYGRFGFNATQQVKAHRFAYELTYGLILPGLLCMHHCDNRPCVRPDHLFLGTTWDNMRDMTQKGRNGAQTHPERIPRGESHPRRLHPEKYARGEQTRRAKLTESQVRDIRQLDDNKYGTTTRLARCFGVSVGTIRRIVAGKSWGHVS